MKGIFVLTGPFGSGKTSFCQWFARELKKEGIDVRGVISSPDFQGGEKARIWAQDIHSGEKRLLASKEGEGLKIPSLFPWVFNPETILWVNSFLKEAVPCQVLIVDELGPLEFEFNKGFLEAFGAISTGSFKLALVVIRPELLDIALSFWKSALVLNINEARKWGQGAIEALRFSFNFPSITPADGDCPKDHEEKN